MRGVTRDIQIRVAIGIIVLNSVVIAISVIVLKDWRPFVIGNISGFVAAIVNFKLLAMAAESLMAKKRDSRSKVVKYTGSRAVIRLFITGAVIYFSLTSEHISAIGAVIGLLSIKPIILIESILYR